MCMILSKIITLIWRGLRLTSNARQGFNYKSLLRINTEL